MPGWTAAGRHQVGRAVSEKAACLPSEAATSRPLPSLSRSQSHTNFQTHSGQAADQRRQPCRSEL